MSKLFIDKKDTLTLIAEKVSDAPDDVVTLVVPRGSKLGEGNHLHILKNHAEELGKTIIIESIDEHILALADKQEVERIHPLFEGGSKHKTFSDIRSHEHEKAAPSHHVAPHHAPHKAVEVDDETREKEVGEEVQKPKKRRSFGIPARFRRAAKEEAEYESVKEAEEVYEEREESASRPSSRRRLLVGGILGGILILIVGGWGVGKALGRADLSVTLAKTPWQSSAVIVADKAPSAARAGDVIISATLFTEKKNTIQFFKATGKKQTSQKAVAKVMLYNGYDSSPQALVATTRLATPDGKIFRLDKGVTVPGAKLENGKITPAGIEVAVTADQPGPTYNVGPFEKMTVVGFKGTPKYDGFYAVMKEKAKGGIIGEAPFPTDDDIKKAEDKTKGIIQSSLDLDIRRRVPEELKILKEASSAQISKLIVDTVADEQGNFSVQGEGQLSVIVFKESDVETVLSSMMTEDHPKQVFKTITLSYASVQPDFTNGKMSMTVKADAVLTSPLDEDALKAQVSGKSLDGAKQILAGLVGLEQGKIGIYPPWLWSMPTNPERITITVD